MPHCCLFFLRFSLVSLHCCPIQFSFAFFMHLLMLFTSLYFSDPSGSNFFFLSQFYPLVAQIRNFCSDPGFFSDDVCHRYHWLFLSLLFWRWWSSNPCLHLSSLFMMMRDASCPPIKAFWSQTWVLCCFRLQILFRQRWKVTSSKLWSLPMSASGKLHVLAMFPSDWKRFLTSNRMLSIWL